MIKLKKIIAFLALSVFVTGCSYSKTYTTTKIEKSYKSTEEQAFIDLVYYTRKYYGRVPDDAEKNIAFKYFFESGLIRVCEKGDCFLVRKDSRNNNVFTIKLNIDSIEISSYDHYYKMEDVELAAQIIYR